MNSPFYWYCFCLAWFLIFYVGLDKPFFYAAPLGIAVGYIVLYVIVLVKL